MLEEKWERNKEKSWCVLSKCPVNYIHIMVEVCFKFPLMRNKNQNINDCVKMNRSTQTLGSWHFSVNGETIMTLFSQNFNSIPQ